MKIKKINRWSKLHDDECKEHTLEIRNKREAKREIQKAKKEKHEIRRKDSTK